MVDEVTEQPVNFETWSLICRVDVQSREYTNYGATENAGLENARPSKIHGWKKHTADI